MRELLVSSGVGEDAPAALRQLLAQEQAILLGGLPEGAQLESRRELVASRTWWSAMAERIQRDLAAYHHRYPLRRGMPREALRSSLKLDARLFNALLDRATGEDLLMDRNAFVWLPSHEVRFSPQQEGQVEALMARFRREPYATPSVKEPFASE